MKIIDKNTDYYDFYQNIYRDSTFVFDRRDSYSLSKEEFAHYFTNSRHRRFYSDKPNKWAVVLQVCNTFWGMELTPTKEDNYGWCLDYTLRLIASWRDYDAERTCISLKAFPIHSAREIDSKWISSNIRRKDSSRIIEFNNFRMYVGNDVQIRHIPILKGIGIPALVDPFDVYNSLEEYFGAEKTASERTEPEGATNDDKISSHGFDTRTSFRKMS